MADYGWGLSEETEKKARRELNEFPERRKVSIESVREQMCTRPDISKSVFPVGEGNNLVILITMLCLDR